MTIRRVVTGHSTTGRSVFLSDELVDPRVLDDGTLVDLLWASDSEAVVPNDGTIDEVESWTPAPGGIRVFRWVQQPSVDFSREGVGCVETNTIDVNLVLSGEVWLQLDDDVVTHLAAGDVVVQNGVRPRWENRSHEPATVVCMSVGADRRTPPRGTTH